MKAIRGKVQTVGKLTKMMSTLRQESEDLLKLKGMSPDGKLPRGLLLAGKPAIKNAMK
jgi:serine/threonine-protein phosphatase 2B catalytic subunit